MQNDEQRRKEQENGWGGTSTGGGTGPTPTPTPPAPPVAASTQAPTAPTRVDPVTGVQIPTSLNQFEALQTQLAQEYRRIKSAAGWFYAIAGFSIVNTVMHLFNSNMRFVIGLGATEFVDAVSKHFHANESFALSMITLAINIVIAGFYAMFGYCLNRRVKWVVIVGMVCYALDTLILFGAWVSVAFHVYALICISAGIKAEGKMRRIEAEMRRVQPL